MVNFELYLPTKLVFGKNEHKNIDELMAPFVHKVLIDYGSEQIKKCAFHATSTNFTTKGKDEAIARFSIDQRRFDKIVDKSKGLFQCAQNQK